MQATAEWYSSYLNKEDVVPVTRKQIAQFMGM